MVLRNGIREEGWGRAPRSGGRGDLGGKAEAPRGSLRSAMTTYQQNINRHHTPHTILKPSSMPTACSLAGSSWASTLNLKTKEAEAYLSVICHVTEGTPDTLVIESSQLFCEGDTITMPILQARKDTEDFKA